MLQTMQNTERRRFERFELPAGYSPIAIRTTDEREFGGEGFAYDISEGGIRFECDRAIDPGTTVSLRIDLPIFDDRTSDVGPGRAVFVTGNVVWCDIDDPGVARMAVAITRFDRAGDRDRLLSRFTSGQYLRAA